MSLLINFQMFFYFTKFLLFLKSIEKMTRNSSYLLSEVKPINRSIIEITEIFITKVFH